MHASCTHVPIHTHLLTAAAAAAAAAVDGAAVPLAAAQPNPHRHALLLASAVWVPPA